MTGEEIPVPRPGDIVTVPTTARYERLPVGTPPVRLRVHSATRSRDCIGWAWLHGIELDIAGQPTARRSLFVDLAGLPQPPPLTPWWK
jgi:hypothetical protein